MKRLSEHVFLGLMCAIPLAAFAAVMWGWSPIALFVFTGLLMLGLLPFRPHVQEEVVISSTTDLCVGDRVSVMLEGNWTQEVWRITEVDRSKASATAIPVLPYPTAQPTITGPLRGDRSPFRKMGIPG